MNSLGSSLLNDYPNLKRAGFRPAAYDMAKGTLAANNVLALGSDLVPTWTSLSSGAVVKQVRTETSAVATGGTQTPNDDTIPQNTEGDQYLSLAITPASSSNILVIEFSGYAALHNLDGTALVGTVALFQDSTANALAATQIHMILSNAFSDILSMLTLRHSMTAGTTSSTTFKIRIGNSGSFSTITLNGVNGARKMGGVAASFLTITEYTA